MEIPIQVAVRIYDGHPDEETNIVQSIPGTLITTNLLHNDQQFTDSVIQVKSNTFPVTHALPINCSQNQLYVQTIFPLLASFLSGFDASFVIYGQKKTGKTYTMIGPGFDCVYGESEQGIIQRFVRDVFNHLNSKCENFFVINISWIEICNDEIHDLLDSGSVQCLTISDVFRWLQIGLNNRSSDDYHNLFTFTLEQQWVTSDNIIQHFLSTASFVDLCGTERMLAMNSVNQHISVPKDLGLQSLERIVNTLIDPTMVYYNNAVSYNDTRLTTLLKDSFGGRAQTLLILCVSPLEQDVTETIHNLQFAFKAQCVRNFVILNTFSDNNTPLNVDNAPDTFGLQFAASQWLKLVSNAEGLFSRLIADKSINEQDRERIEEWMFLKQECEDCLSSGEMAMSNQRHLGPIQEADERDETSDQETSCQQNTDNESDSESQQPDLDEKVSMLIDEFRIKTNLLVKEKYNDFIESHPKAVLDSNDSFSVSKFTRAVSPATINVEAAGVNASGGGGCGGRRKSLQPGDLSLSSIEIAMLKRVASRDQACTNNLDDVSTDENGSRNINVDTIQENIQKKIRKVVADLEATQRQTKELEHTINLKQKLISDLIKNNDTRTSAKQRFNKKKSKLEAEYEKTKKHLSKAVVNGRDRDEIERLKQLTSHIEQRLADLVSIKHIAGESGHKLKQHQQSLQVSKKQLEVLQKSIKKEKKLKESLENELKNEKLKANKAVAVKDNNKGKNIRDVSARISHLDHVLKEKSQNLEQYNGDGEGKDSLRHEIRNLRRTRDHLLEQRFGLDRKLKKEKMLSHKEERKLLECDEAIEAIDLAIEFKNELICGRKSIDTNERLQREKGEQMLMARLNKLSTEEMRTILYKYFQKVIDLRDSSRKLEVQLMAMERERDAWEWRERVLNNAVRQARLEGESHAVLLQQQQEKKVAIMLRHLAEETSASSSITDHALAPQSIKPNVRDREIDLDIYKPSTSKQLLKAGRNTDLDFCRLPIGDGGQHYKYKPLDKIKEKDRESKNKLFAKFQVLARYHGGDKRKIQDSSMSIPEQNLRHLQPISLPVTKVTREKNKIIIQQDAAASQRH